MTGESEILELKRPWRGRHSSSLVTDSDSVVAGGRPVDEPGTGIANLLSTAISSLSIINYVYF